MTEYVPAKRLRKYVSSLRARAIDQAMKSESNDNKKGWWQAGQAEGYGWAADHLEAIIDSFKERK